MKDEIHQLNKEMILFKLLLTERTFVKQECLKEKNKVCVLQQQVNKEVIRVLRDSGLRMEQGLILIYVRAREAENQKVKPFHNC